MLYKRPYGRLPAFEFDPNKSNMNETKHGIDFVSAQTLWLDDRLVCMPVSTQPERRYIAVGKIASKHWTAVFTLRVERVRLISVRRSRLEEVRAYEGH